MASPVFVSRQQDGKNYPMAQITEIYILIWLSVCTPIFSEVLRRTTITLGVRGAARAGEGQIWTRRRRDVGKGSSKVKWGQISIVYRMEAKLGGWSRRPMETILKVSSRSSGVNQRSNPYSLSYGSETWWVGISSDDEHFGGQIKVIRGHTRSNFLQLLYGLETGGCSHLWMLKMLKATSRSSGVTRGQIRIVYRMEVKPGGCRQYWRSVQGHQGSPTVKWLAIIIWTSKMVDEVICGC